MIPQQCARASLLHRKPTCEVIMAQMNNEQSSQGHASSVHQKVSEGTSKIADKAEKTGEEFKAVAIERVQHVRDSAQTGMERSRDELAARLRRVSGAIRQSGEQLRPSDSFVAGYMDRATQQVDRAATYVTQSDLQTVVRDTERFARERPLVFFGGAFLLGLATGRFLKSSAAGASQGSGMMSGSQRERGGMMSGSQPGGGMRSGSLLGGGASGSQGGGMGSSSQGGGMGSSSQGGGMGSSSQGGGMGSSSQGGGMGSGSPGGGGMTQRSGVPSSGRNEER
jgi:hypothetical protein